MSTFSVEEWLRMWGQFINFLTAKILQTIEKEINPPLPHPTSVSGVAVAFLAVSFLGYAISGPYLLLLCWISCFR